MELPPAGGIHDEEEIEAARRGDPARIHAVREMAVAGE